MIKLSVVILTKNEEKNIRECLLSVFDWANEIIIIDDESIDKTLDIAKEYNVRIVKRPMDNEGRQRNFAYAQASNLWVLSLDADERIPSELKKEIEENLAGEVKFNGWTIPRRNFIGDHWVRYGGWYPSPQLKLFRKDKFRYEEAQVHPRAFMDDPCGHLKGDIIHYSYKSIADFLAKLNNQTTREAQKWHAQNKPMTAIRFVWRAYDRFARTYWTRQAYKEGYIGFMIAYFAGLYQLLSYFKYKEIIQIERKT